MPYLPPLNLIRKKNEFLAPDFPADSSQFFRVHGFASAVRQMPTAMHNPFAWTNVSSGKNACFAIWPHVGTKFFNSSHHFLSMDGWPGDAIFFLWGQPLKIIPQVFSQKKVQPLGFYFWHLRLGLFKSPFFGWWSWRYVVVPFCKDKCIFSKKHMFCNLGARWHKILEFVPSCPICGWLAWRCDFFLWGQPLKIIHKNSAKKRSSPLDFIFDTCASASSSHLFLVGEAEDMWLYPFARTNAFSAKNICFVIWARVDTKFLNSSHHVLSVDDWPGDATFFLWGQPLKIIHKNSAKKRSSPLDFIFDTCASASSSHLFLVGEAEDMWLYPFARTNAFSAKNICFVIWARVDTKFFNSSHHVLSVDDWPGDAIFSCGVSLWRLSRKYSVKKRSSPLDFIFDTCASASSSHFFGWWSWTCVSVPFCKDNCIFSKKTCVLQFGRALTQNSWIRPIMSYLWMIGLVMRLFSCGANIWRSSASIQSKKVQPLGFYFWPLRLGLLKSLFLVGEGEHMCLYPFAKSCTESYPLK